MKRNHIKIYGLYWLKRRRICKYKDVCDSKLVKIALGIGKIIFYVLGVAAIIFWLYG